MIVFKKIRWKNFLSTGNVFSEIEFNKSNTTLIIGENGAGKSTILDALSFALFSKPFRKVNKPQLVNSITKKEAVVEVEFDIHPHSYKIVRGLKPGVFEVYQNDNLINQSAEMKDYQEILEKHILKINHKSFCQVVVLGSATFQPFMQLPGGQRREIIEDLLDLQIFTTMNTLLKDKITTNKDAIVEANSQKRLINEKMSLISEHLRQIQNSNEAIIKDKIDRIATTNESIETLDKEYWTVTADIKTLQDSIVDEPSVSKKINQLSTLKQRIEANLDILNKDVKFFHEYDNCPTCTQQINSVFKAEAIDTKQAKIGDIKEGLVQLSLEYDKVSTRISEMSEVHASISDKNLECHRIKTKMESLAAYRKELQTEIESIEKTNEEIDDSKLIELQSSLTSVINDLKDKEEEKITLNAAASLLKDGGIKSRIIKQYIPVINKLINKYLAALEFVVQFELDEEFNETIKSRFRDEFSYASFSEGEKMRINLAILFTWRAVAKLRNSINTNILIMDEVFDSSLDSTGIEEFMKILNQLTVDTNTFIISHKSDQIGDKFENVIKFEKNQNFSRIAK
jgi:DNA repair exonuclease SbcCD ATPase subunit